MKALPVVLVIILLAGCGTLPSAFDVEKKFIADHPGVTVEKVTYEIKGERSAQIVRHEAQFEIHYRAAGDSAEKVAYRRFRSVPEGWIEDPER